MSYFGYNYNLRNVTTLPDQCFIDYILRCYNDFSDFHITIHLFVFTFLAAALGNLVSDLAGLG